MVKRFLVTAFLTVSLVGCGKQAPITSGGRTASFWAEALQNSNVEARRKAAAKLGPLILIDKEALPALLDALKDADAQVRSRAAWCLGVYSAPKAHEVLPVLEEVRQQDKDVNVRDSAAKAIEKLSSAQPANPG